MYLVLFLIAAGLITGFFYRSSIFPTTENSSREEITDQEKIADQENEERETDEKEIIEDKNDDSPPAGTPNPGNNFREEALLRISAAKAANALNSLNSLPKEKHAEVFSEARTVFKKLRQSKTKSAFTDSLYILCADKGARSFMDYQLKADPVSKQYAIEWYKTAYELKPSADLQDRLERMKSNSKAKSEKPRKTNKSTKKPSPYFERDPEIK